MLVQDPGLSVEHERDWLEYARGAGFISHALAYVKAAELLAAEARAVTYVPLQFPVVFCCRHGLELGLKHLLWVHDIADAVEDRTQAELRARWNEAGPEERASLVHEIWELVSKPRKVRSDHVWSPSSHRLVGPGGLAQVVTGRGVRLTGATLATLGEVASLDPDGMRTRYPGPTAGYPYFAEKRGFDAASLVGRSRDAVFEMASLANERAREADEHAACYDGEDQEFRGLTT